MQNKVLIFYFMLKLYKINYLRYLLFEFKIQNTIGYLEKYTFYYQPRNPLIFRLIYKVKDNIYFNSDARAIILHTTIILKNIKLCYITTK